MPWNFQLGPKNTRTVRMPVKKRYMQDGSFHLNYPLWQFLIAKRADLNGLSLYSMRERPVPLIPSLGDYVDHFRIAEVRLLLIHTLLVARPYRDRTSLPFESLSRKCPSGQCTGSRSREK